MNINKELLQFYSYKKLIKRKNAPEILSECKARKSNVRDYLLAKEMITETNELEARAAYYCMPCVEIDMLEIDDSLFEKFTYDETTGAYSSSEEIVADAYDNDGTVYMQIYCFNSVVKVSNGKILSIHSDYRFDEPQTYGSYRFVYNNIGIAEVSIPQYVIDEANANSQN